MTRPSSTPAAVLFDLDGTLIDTYRLYLESYRRAVAPILGRLPEHDEIAARAPSAERRFLADWIGDSEIDECHGALCRHYAELQSSMGEGPYEGVREMLAALRTAGYPLGIVTGKGRRIWEVTEEIFDPGIFRVVVTEEVDEPRGARAAAERSKRRVR